MQHHRRFLRGFMLTAFIVCNPIFIAYSDEDMSEQGVGRYTRETNKPFIDVLTDVEFAISQFNYRLTGRNRVGSAIAGMEEGGYKEATVLHFCNTQAAAEILEINTAYLLHMPCRITVRERLDSSAVVVDARLLTEDDPAMLDIAKRVNKMMKEIVNFSIQD